MAGVRLYHCADPLPDDRDVTGSGFDDRSGDPPDDGDLTDDVFFLVGEHFFNDWRIPDGLLFFVADGVLVHRDVPDAFAPDRADIWP